MVPVSLSLGGRLIQFTIFSAGGSLEGRSVEGSGKRDLAKSSHLLVDFKHSRCSFPDILRKPLAPLRLPGRAVKHTVVEGAFDTASVLTIPVLHHAVSEEPFLRPVRVGQQTSQTRPLTPAEW